MILMNCIDLESEMYQLSHLLIEQSNILTTLHEQNSTKVEDVKGVLLENTKEGKHKYHTELKHSIQFKVTYVIVVFSS